MKITITADGSPATVIFDNQSIIISSAKGLSQIRKAKQAMGDGDTQAFDCYMQRAIKAEQGEQLDSLLSEFDEFPLFI